MRREFITLLGGAAAWPHILVAQGIDRSRRIGVLMDFAATDPQAQSNVAALQRGLYKLGWSQGGNLAIDYRWARGDAVLVWKFAKELVELRPDVIVAHSSPVVTTLLGETRNIPIVFVSIPDPVGEGFVASFAHPGGNVAGFTNFERWRCLSPAERQEATARCANRRLPVSFKALIRRGSRLAVMHANDDSLGVRSASVSGSDAEGRPLEVRPSARLTFFIWSRYDCGLFLGSAQPC